jgi:hypothetical protein
VADGRKRYKIGVREIGIAFIIFDDAGYAHMQAVIVNPRILIPV